VAAVAAGEVRGGTMASFDTSLPVAFVKVKRGERRCTVCKITFFKDDIDHAQPVLAIAWKEQQGTREYISIPREVVKLAEQLGVQDVYLRSDKEHDRWMRHISLREFQHKRIFNKHDSELYIKIGEMRPVPWRDWLFAEDEVEIASHEQQCQLRFDDLLGGGEVAL
jgi:hypothetical protein